MYTVSGFAERLLEQSDRAGKLESQLSASW